LVEIAGPHSNASVIIMDEPTSAISDQEAELLFSIIEELKKEGKTIAYISHKFKEIFAVADRYVVLRDGHTVDEGEMKDATQESLIRKMTGRDIAARTSFTKSGEAPTLFSVKNLCLQQGNKNRLDHLSFELKEGEILGIYGLMGAGRTELMETIFGLHPASMSTDITVKGKKYIIRQPAYAINAGIELVPEDRKLQGLVLNQSVNKNIGITILQLLERWGLVLDRKKEEALSAGYINSLRIKTPSAQAAVQNLSGGNQQKIVIAKWLATKPAVLLLDEPTRGIDINAKSEIYELMRSLAAEGMGIIMVSSEMPEILALADRILVMNDGRITANLPAATATEQDILSYAIQKTELHT
jgi:ribose transport system ATP-binding protein